jgi:hypothetical protein
MVGAVPRQPSAVLVVSAWREGAPPTLAARITYTLDAADPDRVTVTAAGADEIHAVVRRWLADVEAARGAR